MNREIGIWLDYKTAYFMVMQEGTTAVAVIQSEVEDYRPSGGAPSKTPWGPQDSVKEKKYLERKKQQLRRFFQVIMEKLEKGDELYIFGPAEAKLGLKKAIESDNRLSINLRAVETADQMTENQKVAQVRAFFSQS